MKLHRPIIAVVLAVSTAALGQDRSPAMPPGQLINAVIANELGDREQQRKWMYLIEKREGTQSLSEEQVETRNGPVYRVLAMDGKPLTPDQRQQDNARIRRLLKDTGQQAKLKQQYDDDEQKLEKLMRVMPEAFLYDYDGVDGKFVRLKFRPDPNYNPPNYEARVVHSLAGTILIDPQQHRLAKLSGQLINSVQFGWGILGHVDTGGTFEIERVPVGPSQWKTALLSIHLTGRMILFKTVSKQQYEVRSNFREVPADLTLSQANELLISQGPPRQVQSSGAASLRPPKDSTATWKSKPFNRAYTRCRRSQLPLASNQSSRARTLVRASAIEQSAAP